MWTRHVNLGREVGLHTLKLVRYQQGGTVCVAIAQLADVFVISAAQFRAAVKDAKGYFVEDRPEFLSRFKALGLVGQAATKVTLAGVRLAARVLRRLHVNEHATDALHTLHEAQPPPQLPPPPPPRPPPPTPAPQR